MAPIGVQFRTHDITAASAPKTKMVRSNVSLVHVPKFDSDVERHQSPPATYQLIPIQLAPKVTREEKRENNCELKRLAVTIFPFSISMMIPSDYTIRNIYISFE